MRVATIDIGTNTVLLLVAERGADGELRAIEERATITRLGEGVDRTHRLRIEAVQRTVACIEEYARVIQACGVERLAAVGTSAMRDAGGGEEFRARVRGALGVDVRVVSGEEEARLTFRGALSGLAIDEPDSVAVFDIGGGSTEVVIGRAAPPFPLAFAASFDVGSVRLTERHIAHDPALGDELEATRRAAQQAFAKVPPLPTGTVPVGVAGTMTTIAAVALAIAPYDGARVHGQVLSRTELARIADELAASTADARRARRGMEPKRADVIVAGAFLALALLDHWGADSVRISDRGVRWGLAEELTS